jgi:acyl-CoA synthetase (AMP-forming)/AMP-acid ligase II
MGVAALPKGCMIKHRSLAANAHAMVGCFGLTTGERFWDPMPMFHLTSLLPMHSCFATEATFASMSHFHPDVAMDLLDTKLRAVVYSCFPPVTMAIYHHPLCQVGVLGWANGIQNTWRRSSGRGVVGRGGPGPDEVLEALVVDLFASSKAFLC